MQARKVYMGEARQCPTTEYYTVIMANQDTRAEAGSHWVPRVPQRGVWTGMKATVSQPPASVTRVILRTRESPLPTDSHPLVPTPQPLYLAETFCSSFYSGSPGAMPGSPSLTKSSCLLQAWFKAPTAAQHPSPMQVR